MKWGVRKNPTKAYHRALRKKQGLDETALKYDKKASAYKLKSLKAKAGGFLQPPNYRKSLRYESKSVRYELKAAAQRERGSKWMNSVASTFKDYKIEAVPGERVKVGMLFSARYVSKYNVTPIEKKTT